MFFWFKYFGENVYLSLSKVTDMIWSWNFIVRPIGNWSWMSKSFLFFANIIKNYFLVCKKLTDHVAKLMMSLTNIICKEAFQLHSMYWSRYRESYVTVSDLCYILLTLPLFFKHSENNHNFFRQIHLFMASFRKQLFLW